MGNLIELHIKDFRAIANADIILNGITVVAGINGAGKSTMSKLLYNTFKYANNYEILVLREANKELRAYLSVLEQLVSYGPRSARETIHGSVMSLFYDRIFVSSLDDIPSFIDDVKLICKKFIDGIQTNEGARGILFPSRLKRILGLEGNCNAQEIEKSVEELKKRIISIVNKARRKYEERPLSLLKEQFLVDFNQFPTMSISEYGEEVFKSKVPILHYVKKTLYVDTPMAIGLGVSASLPTHWNEMNTIIREPSHRGYSRSINNIIKNKILKGDVVYDDSEYVPMLKYKRDDDKIFNLADCATGIKSMALLQLLLKNRYLDESTLLIIDEPEAHLHPQWIIEYARVLVLLNKKIGVKLFITSHSTDMVSAIKYISEKEKVADKVSFYVADEKDNHKYDYTFLKNDIEPIFESFNKSFDVLGGYVEN